MADKKSFLMFKSWEPFFRYPSEEDAGRLIKAIYEYQMSGEIMPDCDPLFPTFMMMKNCFDENEALYQDQCSKRSEAARTREALKRETTAGHNCAEETTKSTSVHKKHNCAEETTKSTDTDIDIDTDTDIENQEKEKAEREKPRSFRPPTVSDVRAYCTERKNQVDPERFVDFYQSKGWKVGNSSMKDWKAAVRNWESRQKEEHPPNRAAPVKKNGFNSFESQHNYDFDALERTLSRPFTG